MKTILILMDTLRKDYLPMYNPNTDVLTPNLENLAKDSTVFKNHFTGSLPCMPARRDILTGRLDFFEREWGGLEPYDKTFLLALNKKGINTHIVTDHYHYWELGGEGFLQSYDSFDIIRGQVTDRVMKNKVKIPNNTKGFWCEQHESNMKNINDINDYPLMKTISGANKYLEHMKDESFFLQVEGFDPHQPFEAPSKFLEMYNSSESNLYYKCPSEGRTAIGDEYNEYIKARYKANISFMDYAIGKLVNKLHELDIYDECNIIFTTDHGYHMGEHGLSGKGVAHPYNEITNIPLLIKTKKQKENREIIEYTQNIDIAPTICELHKVEFTSKIHGKSWGPLLTSKQCQWRKSVVSGFHGKSVMYKNQRYTLYCGPKNEYNHPSYEYKCVPTTFHEYLNSVSEKKIAFEEIEMGRFLKHTKYPTYKFKRSSMGIEIDGIREYMGNEVYQISDVNQCIKIGKSAITKELCTELKAEMERISVPSEQYIRLGLTKKMFSDNEENNFDIQ